MSLEILIFLLFFVLVPTMSGSLLETCSHSGTSRSEDAHSDSIVVGSIPRIHRTPLLRCLLRRVFLRLSRSGRVDGGGAALSKNVGERSFDQVNSGGFVEELLEFLVGECWVDGHVGGAESSDKGGIGGFARFVARGG